MPYRDEYVEPEVFLLHQGVTVYNIYYDDDYDEPSYYLYTTDINASCDDENLIDLRTLPNPHDHNMKTLEGGRAILREAIDQGLIAPEPR